MTIPVYLKLTPQTIRFIIRACKLASGLQHDDPNDQWLYHDLAQEIGELYEAEQERLETNPDLEKEALDMATDALETAGDAYLWWDRKLSWRELDPIGKDEFQAVVAAIIRAYLKGARERINVNATSWQGGIKSARIAAAALRDWLTVKLDEWQDLDDDLPGGWDWNDVPLFEIAIQELYRLGHSDTRRS